ncbi:MAG: RluA family pseudouridine synthase [Peptostreptococcaceae bacterium]|nr:RluA family pseudouridine synthase [Peptostreptococcaceae bacterium]
MSKFNYIVTEDDVNNELQIKALLRYHFKFSSRLNKKIKRENLILLNGKPVKTYLLPAAGDIISISMPEEISDFNPEEIPIEIVYEDDDLLVINKQYGIVVHPTKGHHSHTIANGIMKYMLDSKQSFKIRFINRLDMDTSGILVVAKNSHVQDDFAKQVAMNLVEKKYIAVVKGIVENDEGIIDLPIGRPDIEKPERSVLKDSSGANSITHYKVIERYKTGYTLVELILKTGRTHQIRVHMSHIGHPVVGDHLYGGSNVLLIERQALHAHKLSFFKSVTKEKLQLEAPVPADIAQLISKLQNPIK